MNRRGTAPFSGIQRYRDYYAACKKEPQAAVLEEEFVAGLNARGLAEYVPR
jgi:hypothetical protein